MALSEDKTRISRGDNAKLLSEPVVANGVTVYLGSLVCLNASGRITTAPANSLVIAGVAEEQVTGDSSKTCLVSYGHEVLMTNTTGLTAGQMGKDVYMFDDDRVSDAASATDASGVTKASVAVKVGRMTEFTSSGAFVQLANFQGTDA